MGQLATGLVGAGLGFAAGGPFGAGLLGARIGFGVGTIAGAYLFPPKGPNSAGPRLQNLELTTANEGAPLPITYGAVRVPTTVIWTSSIEEIATTRSGGGKGGAPGSGSQTTYTYQVSFAVSVCEGEVDGVRRIWADRKLIYDASETATAETVIASRQLFDDIGIYPGSETQAVDPLIQSIAGAANTPAFLGTCYVRFTNLQLANFGNRLPVIEVEVVRGTTTAPPSRIVEYDPLLPAGNFEYLDGVWSEPIFTENDPTDEQTTHTIDTRNLAGDLLERRTYVGQNINNAVSAEITEFRNYPTSAFMFQGSAGTGFGTGSYWGFELGGAEGIVIPADPRPWGPQPGQALQYYYAIMGAIFWNNELYAENGGQNNLFGIAVYPLSGSDTGLFSSEPSRFLNLEAYLAPANLKQLSMHAGDDGYLYVTRAAGGAFLNGDHVIRVDSELAIIDSFELPAATPAGSAIAAYADRMITVSQTDAFTTGVAALYDISAATLAGNGNVAVELNTTEHGLEIGGANDGQGIGSGLWIQRDGVWTMSDTISVVDPTLESIVVDIATRTGLTAGQVDASALSQTVKGFVVNNPMSAAAALRSLQPAFFFDVFESDAKIKCTNRGGASVVTIPDADLGAHTSKPPSATDTISRQQEVELPEQVDVIYMDASQDYQLGAQLSRRIITTSKNKSTLELPIVLTSTQAAQIADITLQSAWTERVRHQFTLPIKYAYLEPSDLVTISTPHGSVLVRIQSLSVGANNVIDIEALEDASVLYSSVEVGNDAAVESTQTLSLKGPTRFEVIDVGLLRDIDNDYGYYLAASGYYAGWTGASIVRAGAGLAPVLIGAVTTASVMGMTTAALGDSAVRGYDVHNTFNVQLLSGALSSVTEEQFLAGENAALIGDEIVFFKTATAESDGTYTGSVLLRGLAGTASSGHSATDRFVLLDSGALFSASGASTDTGASATFQATTFGVSNATPAEQTVALTNGRVKPNAPAHAFANREASGDFIATFIPSARQRSEWIDGTETPIDESSETYEIDVMDGATVVRTIDLEDARTFTYTAAQQSTDFGATQNAVTFNLYQMSDRVGRGKAANFTGRSAFAVATSYDAAVLAADPLVYLVLNANFKAANLGTIADTTLGMTDSIGAEGVEYDYTATSPFAGDTDAVLEHASSLWTIASGASSQVKLDAMGAGFSVEFLIKHTMTASGNFASLVKRGDYTTPGDPHWSVFLGQNNRDDMAFRVVPDGGTFQDLSTSAAAINDGQWHHIVCVWDNATGGSGETLIYVDGVEAASADTVALIDVGPEAVGAGGEALHIGQAPETGSDAQFTGALTRIALYDYALTPAQVAAHHAHTGI